MLLNNDVIECLEGTIAITVMDPHNVMAAKVNVLLKAARA